MDVLSQLITHHPSRGLVGSIGTSFGLIRVPRLLSRDSLALPGFLLKRLFGRINGAFHRLVKNEV